MSFLQDAGTRAFRDSSGLVQLIMSHAGHTRRFSAYHLKDIAVTQRIPASDPRCSIIHQTANDPEPTDFNNWEWLVSPFTDDGTNIFALVHNEFHGWDDPDTYCPTLVPGVFPDHCWYNAITLARSTNQGASYARYPNLDGQLVATPPYQYSNADDPNREPDSKGYFQPTNVVKKGDWYYILFRAEVFGAQQPRGSCVARTQTPHIPGSWRAFDGDLNGPNNGFNVTFVDPYPGPVANPENHVCFPVLSSPARPPEYPEPTGTLANNLVFSRYFNKYMIIDSDFLAQPGDTQGYSGVWYSLSSDLIHWERPKLLMKGPYGNEGCQESPPQPGFRVPSLLDHNSTDRNFNTIGQTAYLYFTKSNLFTDSPCQESLDRDLVRVPIRFTKKPESDRLATLESAGLVHPVGGFEWFYKGSGDQIAVTSERAYDGSYSALVRAGGGISAVVGTFTARDPDGGVGWTNGTDVWYGSAFYLPSGFRSQVPRMMLMRWLNSDHPAAATRYGGVVLNTDDTYRLIRGMQAGSEDNLGNAFTLPEGRWFWLEVHQKLESDATKRPLSEVFVDGKLMATSAAPNAYPDSAGLPIRVHYGFAQRSYFGGPPITIWVDNSSISTMQRGPKGAPSTPTGIRGAEGDRYFILTSNGSPDLEGGGYRIYSQAADGTWGVARDSTSSGYIQTFPPPPPTDWNCTRHRFRISAYKGTGVGEESPLSEAIELRPQTAAGCPP